MAQLQNALMDIGTIGLPPVVSGLSSLASALKIIKTGLDFLPSWAKESALDQFKNAGVAVDDLRKMVLPSIFSPASAGEAAIRSAPYMGRDPRSSMDHPYIPAVTSPQISVAAPNVDVKATTTVTLDGASIAAAVATRVEKIVSAGIAALGRATIGDSGFDGREMPPYPDHVHGAH